MTPTIAASDSRSFRMSRSVRTALAVVMALALAMLLFAALSVGSFLGWPGPGAPDLYGQLKASDGGPAATSLTAIRPALWESSR